MIGVISVWTLLAHDAIAQRWFWLSLPKLFWFTPVPVAVSMLLPLRTLQGDGHAAPFVLTLVLVFLGYSGLGISLWPHIIPSDITIWEAAGPPQSLGFALVGALLIETAGLAGHALGRRRRADGGTAYSLKLLIRAVGMSS